jgi:hypothetical protein
VSAVVANDPTTAGVNWTVSCLNSGNCGSFSPDMTAGGAATTYTSPTNPGSFPVTVIATSVADPNRTATFTIAQQ